MTRLEAKLEEIWNSGVRQVNAAHVLTALHLEREIEEGEEGLEKAFQKVLSLLTRP